jgi:hypothetical protein
VANGFVFEYIKIGRFLDKIRYFQFNSLFSIKNNSKGQNRNASGLLVVYWICPFIKAFYTFGNGFKKCGERKNVIG